MASPANDRLKLAKFPSSISPTIATLASSHASMVDGLVAADRVGALSLRHQVGEPARHWPALVVVGAAEKAAKVFQVEQVQELFDRVRAHRSAWV